MSSNTDHSKGYLGSCIYIRQHVELSILPVLLGTNLNPSGLKTLLAHFYNNTGNHYWKMEILGKCFLIKCANQLWEEKQLMMSNFSICLSVSNKSLLQGKKVGLAMGKF